MTVCRQVSQISKDDDYDDDGGDDDDESMSRTGERVFFWQKLKRQSERCVNQIEREVELEPTRSSSSRSGRGSRRRSNRQRAHSL